MNTKPYDQAFKFLAEEDAEALLCLLGAIEPGQDARIELLPREVSVTARLPDQPYLVVLEGERWLVHVEAQTAYNPAVPGRMVEYAMRLHLKYGLRISSYVLVLTSRNPVDPPLSTATLSAGDLQVVLNYKTVCLWQLSAQEALDLNRASLLPFIPLMHGGIDELEKGARKIADITGERQREELALHFLLLGGLRYNRDDLMALIGRETMIPIEELKESSFYQHILDEGRQEGEAALLLRLLEHRFGSLPDWALKRIETAATQDLEHWVTSAVDAQSLEDAIGKD